MKSELKEVKKDKYPYIGIHDDGSVVLFVAKNKGTLINESNYNYGIGHYLDDWCEEGFKPFNGTVTLSND